ncbi:MAG: MlaD family protein, partial [Planctomycetota bacterium]
SLAIGVVFLIVLGGSGQGPKLLFETYVDESVQGLEVGNPVRIQGVALGQVESIGFVLTRYGVEAGLVRIVFSCRPRLIGQVDPDLVHQRLKGWVSGGFRVRLASGGLMSGSYLEMSRVDPEEFPPRELTWDPEFDYIPSMPSVMNQLQADAMAIVRDFRDADIAGTVAEMKDTMAALRTVIEGDVTTTLANIRDGTKDLPGAVARLEKSIDEGVIENLSGLVDRLDRLVADDIRPVSENLKQLTGDLATDLPDTMERINRMIAKLDVIARREGMDLRDSLQSLRGLMADLKGLTEAAQRHPSAVFFGDPPPTSRRDRGK